MKAVTWRKRKYHWEGVEKRGSVGLAIGGMNMYAGAAGAVLARSIEKVKRLRRERSVCIVVGRGGLEITGGVLFFWWVAFSCAATKY